MCCRSTSTNRGRPRHFEFEPSRQIPKNSANTQGDTNDGTDKAYIVRKVAGNATDFSLHENEHDIVTHLRPDCSRRGFRTAS